MLQTKITIDGVDFVRADSAHLVQHDKIVLVRTRSAGVHVGEIESSSGTTRVLRNAHRIWRWRGANTLSELSQKGGDTGYTRISEAVPTIELTEVIEVIKCSLDAAKNLTTPRWPQ